MTQLSLAPPVVVEQVPTDEANRLLAAWGHYLGPCNRPFGSQAWVLLVDGAPVSVAVGASTVSSTVTDEQGRTYRRAELVELARLCSAPDSRWATRVMLRLWREVCAPAWPYWTALACVAYSRSDRHEGRIYRFDGWTRVREVKASGGGGSWSAARADGDAAGGSKALWVWRLTAE